MAKCGLLFGRYSKQQGTKFIRPPSAVLKEGINTDDYQDVKKSWKPIVDYIIEHDLTDIILVGHSFGGVPMAQVAIAQPKRIQQLIFHNAFVLKNGQCVMDTVSPQAREAFERLASSSSNNTTAISLEFWQAIFINDAPELAQETHVGLVVSPFRQLTDSVDQGNFFELEIPTSYLMATEDISLGPLGPEGYYKFAELLGEKCKLYRFPGSHEVMFSNPKLLAEKIYGSSYSSRSLNFC